MIRLRHTSFLVPLLSELFVISCSRAGYQSSIDPRGPQADRISGVWWLMFWVSVVVFILVLACTLLALRRRNASEADAPAAPDLKPADSGERNRRNIVVACTSVTVVILFVFLIVSFLAGRSLTAGLAAPRQVTIEITGHQWWWEARYLDTSASNIFTTANEIHIPAGVPVFFSLRGADVIHSFWVPNLTGKKDLIPGKVATIWLQADQPGIYRGQCAEYCGLQHAHMALWIVADPPDQFAAWWRNQLQSAVPPATDVQKRGQQVFLSSTCVMCHAVNGTPAGSNIGPNLTHVGSRNTLAAATLPNTREHLTHWVTNSQSVKPGNRMPEAALTPEDLNALVEYLQNLK